MRTSTFLKHPCRHLLFRREGKEVLVRREHTLLIDLPYALFVHLWVGLAWNIGRMSPVEIGDVGILVVMVDEVVLFHTLYSAIYSEEQEEV